MSDVVTHHDDDDELTTTQEYLIAAAVILFFGWLFWYLNHGFNFGQDLEVFQPAQKTAVSVPAQAKAVAVGVGQTEPIPLPSASPLPAKPETPAVPVPNTDISAKQVMPAAPAAKAAPAPQTKVATLPVTKTVPTEPVTAPVAPAVKAVPVPQVVAVTPPLAAPAQQVAPGEPAANQPGVEPVSPQETPAAKPEYVLPDGTAVEMPANGFESKFQEAIVKHEVDKPITFDNLHFVSGSHVIQASSGPQIKATAALLNKYPDISILIRGYTDNVGTAKANVQLSLMRANELGLALVKLGIDRQRIRIEGMGDTQPVASNATEEGRRQNRRIDVSILP